MRRGTMRLGAVTAGVVTALIGSTAAFGSTFYVYQGEDFGYIGNDHKHVGVCDREADGFNVYVEYTRDSGAGGRLEESNSYCNSASTGSSPVYRLKTCENIPFAPDPCSGWKEHR